jgi:hypothetical protein
VSQGNADVVRRAIEAFNGRDLVAATRENVPTSKSIGRDPRESRVAYTEAQQR